MTLNKFSGSLLALAGLLIVVGCQSSSGLHNRYIQPRIEGRVIDAQTGMPIERVVVIRNSQTLTDSGLQRVSAGEIQEREHSIYTNGDGEFTVPSKKNLELGGDRTWTAVSVKFLHPDYHMFSTNFLNTGGADASGEPLLQIGEIALHPLPVATDR